MRSYWILWVGLLVACAVGCEDSNSGGSSGIDGTWKGSGFYEAGVAIDDFTMVLARNGEAVSGSYDITRPNRHMVGSVSGTVNGNALELQLNPHGLADGTVSGNSMSLHWWERGFGGQIEGGHANLTLTRQ